MIRAIVVHGINTTGETNTDRLAERLEARGVEVVPVKYSPVRWWSARWRAESIARTVRNYVLPGDAAIAHSFGCLVLYRAMQQGAQFGRVVFFSAAMERKVCFPHDGMQRLLNVCHPYDRALRAGSLLPWHPFGLLGRDGYGGDPDSRIREVQSTARVGPHRHTAPFFAGEHLPHWEEVVHEFLSRV